MFRISKLTDYGIDLLTHFADVRSVDAITGYSAAELARRSHIPRPTVSKLLKRFAQAGILAGSRGARGGYRLIRDPRDLSMAEIISVLEGPIALTDCLAKPGTCFLEDGCATRNNWQRINQKILGSLERMSLADMLDTRVNPRASRYATV